MKVLIVQPWFTALGHPAQSVLNTAKVLGVRSEVGYLISDPGNRELAAVAKELEGYGSVARFGSGGQSLRSGTVRSLPAVLRIVRRETALLNVFYLDAHLVALAALWPLLAFMARRVRLVSVVYLGGPERIASHAIARALVSRFLQAPGRKLFLRTAELQQAWRDAFPEIPGDRIDTIPSLEVTDVAPIPSQRPHGEKLRFGVVGQVRPGKSLEWLVPLFERNPDMGTLRVAGTFTNAEHRQRMPFLHRHANFDDRFLSETDMLAIAANQDYLIALYDDWDARMEAATVHLAARVGIPVIVYDEGWPGRMMREFECGIAVSRNDRPGENFFSGLPRPGEARYRALLTGIERFRATHGGAGSRDAFFGKLFDE